MAGVCSGVGGRCELRKRYTAVLLPQCRLPRERDYDMFTSLYCAAITLGSFLEYQLLRQLTTKCYTMFSNKFMFENSKALKNIILLYHYYSLRILFSQFFFKCLFFILLCTFAYRLSRYCDAYTGMCNYSAYCGVLLHSGSKVGLSL